MRNNISCPTIEQLTYTYHSTCLGKSRNDLSIPHGHETQQKNFYLTCLRTHKDGLIEVPNPTTDISI